MWRPAFWKKFTYNSFQWLPFIPIIKFWTLTGSCAHAFFANGSPEKPVWPIYGHAGTVAPTPPILFCGKHVVHYHYFCSHLRGVGLGIPTRPWILWTSVFKTVLLIMWYQFINILWHMNAFIVQDCNIEYHTHGLISACAYFQNCKEICA